MSVWNQVSGSTVGNDASRSPRAIASVTATAFGFALTLAVATPALAMLGPERDEQGDAGFTLESAQPILGLGSLSTIRGTLSAAIFGGDQQDMYLIQIMEPTLISGGGFSGCCLASGRGG